MARTKHLSREEEAECYRRMKAGDMSARETLILSQTGWARRLVANFCRRVPSADFDDLLSIAHEACIIATDKFDPSRGRPTTFVQFVFRTMSTRRFIPGAIGLPKARAVNGYVRDIPTIDSYDPKELSEQCHDRDTDERDFLAIAKLEKALRAIKPEYARVLHMRYWEDRTFADMRSEMRGTVSACQQTKERALRHLAAAFRRESP